MTAHVGFLPRSHRNRALSDSDWQALVAGGTFNGDLYVWDLGRESDMQVGRSDTASPVLHLEPILAIHWQHSTAEASRHSSKVHAYRLVTLGADGRVLVWHWHKVQSPVYGCVSRVLCCCGLCTIIAASHKCSKVLQVSTGQPVVISSTCVSTACLKWTFYMRVV
jgi:hypothetical protein